MEYSAIFHIEGDKPTINNFDAHRPFFSVVDLHSGHHQVNLTKESRKYTAFRTQNTLKNHRRRSLLPNSDGRMDKFLTGCHL